MFGYIAPNLSELDETQRLRYRSVYCGLCQILRRRYGFSGSLTLSNDLTFLALLLNALYEPDERTGLERCIVHPVKSHRFVISEPFEYAADMNIALAYYKCMDNWVDEKNILSRGEAVLLKNAYLGISKNYPKQCGAIEGWISEIREIETVWCDGIDAPVNSTGRLLSELFCWKDDFWSDSLKEIGDGLGRFIYMMDAYEDLPRDVRRKNFNPLIAYQSSENFEVMCRDALMMMVADCTQAFEKLPIVKDADILRNILYSGVWNRYGQIQKKKQTDSKGAK